MNAEVVYQPDSVQHDQDGFQLSVEYILQAGRDPVSTPSDPRDLFFLEGFLTARREWSITGDLTPLREFADSFADELYYERNRVSMRKIRDATPALFSRDRDLIERNLGSPGELVPGETGWR